MRQMVITRHGGPEVLQLRETHDPVPGPGDVRIRVRAAGVNFSDIMARIGLYPDAPRPPCVVGYEVCGHVDAIGAGVTTRREGDRVMALTHFGGYGDTVIVPEAFTFIPPTRLSDVEAAGVLVTYLTAAIALYRMAGLEAGDVVLVHSAAGGVGTAAVQLARLRDARVIGTTSAAKHEAVRRLGAEHCIDYQREDIKARVKALTHGRGVDVVLDPRGGATLRESYALLAPLGRLITFGVSDAMPGTRRSLWRAAKLLVQSPAFRPLSLMNNNRGVFGLHLGRLWTEAAKLQPIAALLIAELEQGRLQPIIARTFPLEEAGAAHRFLHDRSNIGKVVLTT
jgi:NADPH:quinone reductase-like Zn-dependent oxidoreductase